MNNSLKQYIDLHDENLEAINAHSAQQLNALRQEARKALDCAMLPRKGSDDYEATDLNEVLAPDYGVNINHVDLSRESTTKFRCEVPNLSTCLYYVFNDTFRPSSTAGKRCLPSITAAPPASLTPARPSTPCLPRTAC